MSPDLQFNRSSRTPTGMGAAAVSRRGNHQERGTVLIVTLIIMALIALALGSYLSLNLTTARLARKNYQQNIAFNLAEAGAEEAMWSFNRTISQSPDAWTDWTSSSTTAWKKFSGFDLGGNITGTVKVYVNNTTPASGESPTVVAQATVESPGTGTNTRMLQLTLGRRSYFGAGLVVRETIRFAGFSPSVDSWNSDPDNNPATAPLPYAPALRSDHGYVATLSAQSGAMFVNEATIWGRVATGGAPPDIGLNGSIRGSSTPLGVAVDPAQVSANFTANLPFLPAPTDGTPINILGATLGTEGMATRWRIPNIDLHGSQTLTILGDVTLVVTSSSGNAVKITGNAGILVSPPSSLTMYVEGDVSIAGNGLSNGNYQPNKFQIWGTSTGTSSQAIEVGGNGTLKAIIYAPNADVKVNGNGDVMGAIVARNILLTGNASFHYDESLANYGLNTPFKVTRWVELSTAAEREHWKAVFEGW